MRVAGLKCPRCGTLYDKAAFASPCLTCLPVADVGLVVEYAEPVPAMTKTGLTQGVNSLWRYSHSLPVKASEAISLGEGLTPFVPLDTIGRELGLPHLFAKCEFANPTGSFKDRLATAAVSAAKSIFGAKVIASSSTGNAGAAVAAYAAKGNLDCIIFTVGDPSGPFVAQMQAYGAHVITCSNKAQRWEFLSEGVKKYGWFPTSPFFAPPVGSNPYGLEGYKSLAYEIAASLDWDPPEWIVLPICYGDALYGMWRGFRELIEGGVVKRMPRFVAAEIYGSLSAAFHAEGDKISEMPKTHDTAATSISAVQSTYQALFVLRQSEGVPVVVSEEELLQAARLLSAREGLFVEPAAAAAVSAAITLKQRGMMKDADRIVCVLTAGGLKAPNFQKSLTPPALTNFSNLDQVLSAVKLQSGADLRA